MRLDALDYELPEELIASTPPPERDGGRLMVVNRRTGEITHARVRDLARYVPDGAALVVNDTRVIPARLHGYRETGGKVELLLVRALDATAKRWTAMGRASKALRGGTMVRIANDLRVQVESRDDEGMLTLTLETDDPWGAIERHGNVPLPPYMRRAPEASDRERYQTVFARNPGAVAAPTAGLHLTEAILGELSAKGVTREAVTLHVGPGTFLPVTVEDLNEHPMHAEWYDIPARTAEIVRSAKQSGDALVAVGTTVVRTLESWGGDGALQGDTRLLIQPGYTFRVVDRLLTNFHLPRSTLLALVMAFAGEETTRRAYREAVAERYRFFSYGDAMFITE
jgi:S-adenosylmethionine:tRNA ribosyltransferase-isomerase